MRAAPSDRQLQVRAYTLSRVADLVAWALRYEQQKAGRRYTDYRDLSRRVGREMGRTVSQILKEKDTTITTLVDLIDACDCDISITVTPKRK